MRTKTSLRGLCALGLLTVLAAGSCAGPVEEVGELLTEGGEEVLREPMRPVRGTTRMLLVALDGVGADDLREALAAGRLPNLHSVLGSATGEGEGVYEHGYARFDVQSVLPSATTAAWASVYTGAGPAHTGIAGNEWWVREEERFYAPVPVTVSDRSHALEIYTDALLSELVRVPTLFERLPLRTHVSLAPVYRGADLLTFPDLTGFGDLFGAVAESAVEGGPQREPEVHRELDESSVHALLEEIRDREVPDLQVAYFPGVDLFTHAVEEPAERQQDYLAEVIDPALGRILDLYRDRGVLDSTYVVVIADHGHTPVLADDRHSLGVEGGDEPPAVLREAGFRLRPPELTVEEGDFQAVLAYQGGMAYVYLADRSTCPDPGDPCNWDLAPRLEEDVLAAARAFHAANERGEGVPELEGTLDLILARATSGSGGSAPPFEVFDGERLVPVEEYLREHPMPHLVRFEERLRDLAVGPYGHYAGDLLLVPRFGTHRPIGDRFYFAEPYFSEHGSPYPEDSIVPLLVAAPARTGAEIAAAVDAELGTVPSQLDYVGLLRRLLAPGDGVAPSPSAR